MLAPVGAAFIPPVLSRHPATPIRHCEGASATVAIFPLPKAIKSLMSPTARRLLRHLRFLATTGRVYGDSQGDCHVGPGGPPRNDGKVPKTRDGRHSCRPFFLWGDSCAGRINAAPTGINRDRGDVCRGGSVMHCGLCEFKRALDGDPKRYSTPNPSSRKKTPMSSTTTAYPRMSGATFFILPLIYA